MACICEAPTGTTTTFLKQYILLNEIPQTIRTDKGTAFTGKELRTMCKDLNIKITYGTPYIHTATGLVERGIKTLKDLMRIIYGTPYIHTATGLFERGIKTLNDLMRTNSADNCNLNEGLPVTNINADNGPFKIKGNTVRETLRQKTTNGTDKLP